MADSRDITGKNRKFTGTGGIKLPTGSQAQRVNVQGQLRFNTDTNLAEYYDGTDWKPIDAPPTITGFTLDGGSSVTSTLIDNTAGGEATIVISGSNFDTTSGIVVFEPEAGGVNVTTQTITRTNSSSFTVTVTRSDFLEANDPYAIKLTNGSGLAATLASALDVNVAPAFVNSADANLATVFNGATLSGSTANASATDADGDTITYSIVSGSLPGSGLSISSSTGYIEGTLSGSPTSGEYLFTVRAATSNGNTDRQFKLTVGAYPTGGTLVSASGNRYHIYTSSSTFVVDSSYTPNIEVLLVGAGGGGGSWVAAGGGAGGSVSLSSPASISTSAQTYTVTVGAGGAGQINPGSYSWNSAPVTGGDTTLREAGGTYVLTAIGGGRGGSYDGNSDTAIGNGKNGGCGGGRGNDSMSNGSGVQTSASTSPLGTPVSANSRTYGAGADGGSSSSNEGYGQYGGGGLSGSLRGNGDGQHGANYAWINPAGDYGTNTSNSLGAGNYFGGGGGAGNHSGGPVGEGGYGGGASGRSASGTKAPSGQANTGGGAGGGGRSGGSPSEGGNGGSGICVIRYSE